MRDPSVSPPNNVYDVIIIGGGVVGCAILRACTLHGWKCAVIESESDLLSHASGSNSGIACTGVDAIPGSLERALIRDANSQFRIYCKDHGIPTRPCGSLVCLWPWDGDRSNGNNDDSGHDALEKVLEESHDAGDTHATKLTSDQVNKLEPNIASSCRGAVHIPGEIVVDPFLYSISLAVHARENGAHVFTNFEFDPQASHRHVTTGIWTIVPKMKQGSASTLNDTTTITSLQAKAIVNATGLWSDMIQTQTVGATKCPWTAKPRRGQYRIYAPNNNSNSNTTITHPIQPVPTQRTKGIFVFSTIYNHIVVGPTAQDQESRTNRDPDSKVASELDRHAQRIIPGLNVQDDYIGEYVGIRPGTDQRDYQIHSAPDNSWIAVAGIRSTGLTASLGIGNYVQRCLSAILGAPVTTSAASTDVKTTQLPSLSTLMKNYQCRNDGYVEIHGHEYKVTHPLTRLGWSSIQKEKKTSFDGQQY